MFRQVSLCALAAAVLSGCSLVSGPLGLAVAGAGTTAAVSHSVNGTAHRTFTAPLEEVKEASIAALKGMGIEFQDVKTVPEGELITANSERRSIEIELEPISSKTTRMKVIAKNGGILYDAATATEIVLQTEKYLPEEVVSSSAGASRRPRR